jgi:hypothetical protein
MPKPVNKQLFEDLPEIKHKKPQKQNEGELIDSKNEEDDKCLIC